jgi:hypothetical protein
MQHNTTNRLACAPGALPAPLQQQLSAALRPVVAALLAASLAQAAPDCFARPSAWLQSGAYALLRSLTREEPFVSGGLLPLQPDDAAAVLADLQSRVPAPPPPPPSSAAGSSNGGGASANGDRVAYSYGGAPPQPQKGGTAAASAQLPVPPLLHDDKPYLLVSKLVATAAPAAALRDGAALTRLLAWSSGAMKHALGGCFGSRQLVF